MGKLHIGVPDGSSNREVRFHSGKSRLSFDVKDSNPSKIISLDDGSELEVKVTWKGIKTIKTKPEVVWKNIADKKEFTTCIGALRVQIAQECQDVLKDCKEDELPSDCTKDSHPVITSPDQRWTHVKLQVGDVKSATTGEGSSVGALQPHASVTLAILNHYCRVFGWRAERAGVGSTRSHERLVWG
ncbi:hypothetical protein PVAP13_9KG255000 [Panicum virgatum]|uniref:Uncharacterized protein n=1 Tax=Panicum virgatum TaxID=38727 RepID=A0A8T0NT82_PANVG|nr:hypothetical protein PVAP13_9KG255000 [Panicum virgatum]